MPQKLIPNHRTINSKQLLKKEEKNSIIEICPVRNVIARFSNKWALLVVLVISEHECVRFNELCRLIPDVSSRVLSGNAQDTGSRCPCCQKSVSYRAAKGGIPSDGYRPLARAAHRSTDRMGADEHEDHRQAP